MEPVVSRDHTERLLDALGMPVRTLGPVVSLHPPRDPLSIPGFELDVPGDLSAAAFVLVAAQIVPDSHVSTRRTGLNPTRSGVLEMIPRRMTHGHHAHRCSLGEPCIGQLHGSILRHERRRRPHSAAGNFRLRALAARSRRDARLDVAELREGKPD
jgi:3-phosphoshikimate 1-carboxyvinyltransferase